ncbi:hypothetical protein BKA93DRAFT_826250 [Sparassis latifolia]
MATKRSVRPSSTEVDMAALLQNVQHSPASSDPTVQQLLLTLTSSGMITGRKARSDHRSNHLPPLKVKRNIIDVMYDRSEIIEDEALFTDHERDMSDNESADGWDGEGETTTIRFQDPHHEHTYGHTAVTTNDETELYNDFDAELAEEDIPASKTVDQLKKSPMLQSTLKKPRATARMTTVVTPLSGSEKLDSILVKFIETAEALRATSPLSDIARIFETIYSNNTQIMSLVAEAYQHSATAHEKNAEGLFSIMEGAILLNASAKNRCNGSTRQPNQHVVKQKQDAMVNLVKAAFERCYRDTRKNGHTCNECEHFHSQIRDCSQKQAVARDKLAEVSRNCQNFATEKVLYSYGYDQYLY